ncbi:MAG: dockerin type I repeat-containing protein [Oscillospiraceae bacterium]|nr:dockerin type I repeat-containing protein [Oscillospiraceae bacterium]
MKKMYLSGCSYAMAISVLGSSLQCAAVSAVDDEVTSLYGRVYAGFFSSSVAMYQNEELKMDDIQLCLEATKDPDYLESANPAILYQDMYYSFFNIGSGWLSDCYSLNTTQVNVSEPGVYNVIVVPKTDDTFTFETTDDNPLYYMGKPEPSGKYEFQLAPHVSTFRVTVYDIEEAKNTPFYMVVYDDAIEFSPDDVGCWVYVRGALASDVTYEIEDPAIAEVMYSSSGLVEITPLKEGETIIHAIASDGRTATEKIRVLPRTSQTEEETPTMTTTTSYTRDSEPATTLTTTYVSNPGNTTAPVTTSTRAMTTTMGSVTSTKWWYDYENPPMTTTTKCITENHSNSTAATTTTTVAETEKKVDTNPSTEESDFAAGDANCNEMLDVSDAVLVARVIAEDHQAVISDQGKKNADINQDGNITMEDVMILLKKIARLL